MSVLNHSTTYKLIAISIHGRSCYDFHLYLNEVSLTTTIRYQLTYETHPIVSFASLPPQLFFTILVYAFDKRI